MAQRVLILGGSRYFGRRLVVNLLKAGYELTLATRGITRLPLDWNIKHRSIQRSDRASIAALASSSDWDIVVDQICYSPNDAGLTAELFNGRVGKYILTSSGSVYPPEGVHKEDAFDPFTYPIRWGDRDDFDYSEGKRLAEAVLVQKAGFPLAAVRLPIVLGPDDYTGRLEFHIDRVRTGTPMVVPELNANISFIHAAEAARFLQWLIEEPVTGPINGCSHGQISVREILEIIEARLKRRADVRSSGSDLDLSPFSFSGSWGLDTSRARNLGFRFDTLSIWFPKLIGELIPTGPIS